MSVPVNMSVQFVTGSSIIIIICLLLSLQSILYKQDMKYGCHPPPENQIDLQKGKTNLPVKTNDKNVFQLFPRRDSNPQLSD